MKHTTDGFYLSQERYAKDILERAAMMNCKPVPTLIDAKGKLSTDGAPIDDTSSYHSLASALMYLTMTRPDLAFCYAASLPAYARSTRATPHHAQVDSSVCPRDNVARPPPQLVRQSRCHSILRRRLGQMPKHATLHIWLLCVPW